MRLLRNQHAKKEDSGSDTRGSALRVQYACTLKILGANHLTIGPDRVEREVRLIFFTRITLEKYTRRRRIGDPNSVKLPSSSSCPAMHSIVSRINNLSALLSSCMMALVALITVSSLVFTAGPTAAVSVSSVKVCVALSTL
jgi:hypothetical protein